LLGMLFGVGLGLLVHALESDSLFCYWLLYAADLMGSIFIGLLRMILIPLIFTSIAVGTGSLKAHHRIGRVWKLTLAYFLGTSVLAIATGLVFVNVIAPGEGLDSSILLSGEIVAPPNVGFTGFLKGLVSQLFLNPIQAMAEGRILPTVVAAIFLGAAIIAADKKAKRLYSFLEEVYTILMIIVHAILRLAPIGVMSLLTTLVAKEQLSLFAQVGVFVATVFGATMFHGMVVLPLILKGFTGISPMRFLSQMQPAFLVAFSSSSSSVALPVTMECVEDSLKVDKNIAGFVLPIGTTLNMDGTALYEAIAAIFIANIAGIDLSIGQQVIIFLMAMVGALGAPGIPSAGMVTMAMVLQAAGLPLEGLSILLPIDRLLDTFRTVLNVEGDAVGACVVGTLVGKEVEG
jgi:Na+/H+-dicarboxylate symporter